MNVRPYGNDAVLVETDGPPVAIAQSLTNVRGVREVVPGAQTLLVMFDASLLDADGVGAAVRAAVPTAVAPADALDIPVRYDGADLADVARLAHISEDEVVQRHSAATYTVAFCGFSPGFAYLTGLDDALQLPRLDEPRTSVPAGSVGVAGEFTGVYPRSSPGGWRLLGTTDAVLWNLDRESPALLTPGNAVRFVPQ
ncbi:MAG TPA: 5-oxoprolinase subunit PxpB [Jatrophihabitantaceae bacterium]|nr:5-oxoprolinase subunit PxpB [Jatrophihabitantaceae bacterium]